MKALECQAKDLSLDVVVSSRELLKVLEQGHSVMRMRLEEDESGTRWRRVGGGIRRWGAHCGGLSLPSRCEVMKSDQRDSLVWWKE